MHRVKSRAARPGGSARGRRWDGWPVLPVIPLFGSYDTPSFGSDGTVVLDLLGRCTADIDVAPDAEGVDVLVTFTPDEVSFRASRTIEVGPP